MNFLSETKASVIFLALMAFILASATLVESFAGSDVASVIYHNPGTIVLWGLLAANWFLIWRRRLKAGHIPFGSTLLHLSFAVMLTGAFVTMVSETEGSMSLEAGETKGMIIKDNGHPAGLPFTVGLDSLEISRYPGTGNPSGFTSYITLSTDGKARKETVSVNHPLRVKGWRIYQASYIPETQGSVFSLAHDPWGTTISYLGYALLLLSFIMLTFSPASRFSRLRKTLASLGCISLLLLMTAPQARASEDVVWDRLVVQDSHGRLVSMDSYCREMMRKIHHDETWKGLGPIESVFSIMAEPEALYHEAFIYQKSKEVAAVIGQDGGSRFASFSSLFGSDGSYKLTGLVDEALSVPSRQRSRFQKDILNLDEKANLLYALFERRQMPLFPEPGPDGTVWRTSEEGLAAMLPVPTQEAVDSICRLQQMNAADVMPRPGQMRHEILCNRIKPFKTGAMGYMTCALLLMVFTLLLGKGSRMQRFFFVAVLILTSLVFALHSWGIAARWYCSGQPPMSNSYEVTVFLSWCVALLSLLLSRRYGAASAFGLFFAGALLLVAGMNHMDPAVTPLVPVLQSPWLMFHVAVIIAGYGCFGINFLLSVYGLGTMAVCGSDSTACRRAALLTELFAIVGLMLMTLGTFLGAVWAGESWGTYWSWDPKETWALITILAYVICTHARFVPALNKPKWLFIFSITGMLCVLMTYFGVNYFLVGMHSYAG